MITDTEIRANAAHIIGLINTMLPDLVRLKNSEIETEATGQDLLRERELVQVLVRRMIPDLRKSALRVDTNGRKNIVVTLNTDDLYAEVDWLAETATGLFDKLVLMNVGDELHLPHAKIQDNVLRRARELASGGRGSNLFGTDGYQGRYYQCRTKKKPTPGVLVTRTR